ncbi:hypothetical protein [Micromonospora sp. NPDC003816]|uniref:hypothetical protein n=1 Tax=Micromonospora sp. NPDC003816 TaxID=3364224 RepID=UPI0036C0B305
MKALEELLRAWISGNDTSRINILGLSMVWWGRIGKILQFLGGLTVVFDLLGPERLRRWGDRLREPDAERLERVGKLVRVLHKLPFAFALYLAQIEGYRKDALLAKPRDHERAQQERALKTERAWERFDAKYPIDRWTMVALGALALLAPPALLLYAIATGNYSGPNPEQGSNDGFHIYQIPLFLVGIIVAWLLPGVLIASLQAASIAARAAFDVGIVRPLAAALAATRPALGIRWSAVAIVITGFGLDLLAS